jgi:hypothetical protein
MPVFDTPNTTATYEVPDGVSHVSVDLLGAGGGPGGASDEGWNPGGGAGSGGRLQAIVSVTPGDSLTVELAGAGSAGGPGDQFTGGGSGGAGGASPYYAGGSGGTGGYDDGRDQAGGGGGGGGGSTALYHNGTLIAVAGGGGGGGGGAAQEVGGGGGGGGARGGAAGSPNGSAGNGSGSDGGAGGNSSGGAGSPGTAVVVASSVVASSTITAGGGNTSGATATLAPYTPIVSLSYIADDQLDLDISGGADFDHYEVQVSRDDGSWVSPAGGPGSPGSRGTYSYGPHNSGGSPKTYNASVGLDSSFQFRVRGVAGDGSTSAWTTSGTVYTTPVPPYNPVVSREEEPNGVSASNTIRVQWTNRSDIYDHTEFEFREDVGNGYGAWGDPSSSGPDDNRWFTTSGGYNNILSKDARYQIRMRVAGPDGKTSDWVHADYGNEGGVYFSDDFSSGDLSNWESNGGSVVSSLAAEFTAGGSIQSPETGGYAVQYNYGAHDEKSLEDLSNESDVIIRARLQTASNDSPSEYGYIQWYDGSSWNELQTWGWEYDGQGWITATVTVPDSMLSTDNRIRIGHSQGGGKDWVAFDKVIVSDILHEYTAPSAPTDLSLDASTEREITGSWTLTGAVTNTAPSNVETYFGPTGGSLTETTHSPNTTTHTFTGLLDGEQYTLEVAETVHQYRHGTKTSEWDSTRTTQAATTILPAPTNHQYSNVTAVGADHSWTSNHNNGTTKLQAQHDGSGWQDIVTGLDHSTDSYTIASLLHGDAYDVRVVAETEHTQTEDQ